MREIHWDLGRIMWDKVGMARNAEGLKEAITKIGQLREEFWQDLALPGTDADLNKQLEMAGRVADYLELGELMARDALMREESLRRPLPRGAPDRRGRGQARRRELHASSRPGSTPATNKEPVMHKEDLVFENVELKTRSYK